MANKTHCRKIEPLVIRDTSGYLVKQECLNCGRGLEKTPTAWRHLSV